MNTKTLMGTDYRIRVDFTKDDWTWLCHLLKDASKLPTHCPDCTDDLIEVLSVIEAGEAVAQ